MEDKHKYNKPRNSDDLMLHAFAKVPPSAQDLEISILGACMVDNCFYRISDKIKQDYFYLSQHQHIYSAMQDLFAKGSAIDMLTVIQQLKQMNKLEEVGGMVYVSELTNKVASAAHIESHAFIVKQKHIQRELIKISSLGIEKGYNDFTDPLELLNDISSQLLDLSSLGSLKQIESSYQLSDRLAKEIARLRSITTEVLGITTGFKELDKVLGGLTTGLHIIAARPAMGKSALALSILKNAALSGEPCLFFTIEMPNLSQSKRLLSNLSGVEFEKIKDPRKLSKEENLQVDKGLSLMKKLPIYWDESSTIDCTEIRAKIIRKIKENGIKLVVVDYLQIISSSEKIREQQVSNISRTLKAISKDYEIPVIALAQINRTVDNRSDKRPSLADLRESGAIEQEADSVMFIYRPEYYGIEADEQGNSTRGIAQIIVAKNREGNVEIVDLTCDLKYMRFDNLTDRHKATFVQSKSSQFAKKGTDADFTDF